MCYSRTLLVKKLKYIWREKTEVNRPEDLYFASYDKEGLNRKSYSFFWCLYSEFAFAINKNCFDQSSCYSDNYNSSIELEKTVASAHACTDQRQQKKERT
jgi:hypothetical protein